MDDKALTIKTVNPAYETAMRTLALASLTPDTFLPVGGRMLARMSEPVEDEDGYSEEPDELTVESLQEAEIITSKTESGKHMPVLDIDVPCEYIPSTTPGHGHLYFHKEMTWAKFEKLMKVMVECGLVEEGYASASHARGYSAVRLPWMTKDSFIFKGWVKCAGSPNEEAFALPDVIMESYNPKEDLLTVAKLGSSAERWAIVYQYHLKPNAEKSELSGKYIYNSPYSDSGVTIEDLMGAKGGVLKAAKAHEAGEPYNAAAYANWYIVEPAAKPKTELTKSYIYNQAAKKEAKKKPIAKKVAKNKDEVAYELKASDIFAAPIASAGTHSVGGTFDYADIETKMAESTLKVSYTKNTTGVANWTASELSDKNVETSLPLTSIISVNGSAPAVGVPKFIFDKPVDKVYVKTEYGVVQVVATYKGGDISPLFAASKMSGMWYVETAWATTVSKAALEWKEFTKIKFEDLKSYVEPDEPIPAPAEPTVHYESEDGTHAFDIPEKFIKPWVKVAYYAGSHVKTLIIFNKSWLGGVKFSVYGDTPNWEEPKGMSVYQAKAEKDSFPTSDNWHMLKKKSEKKPVLKYVSKADSSVTVKLPEGMWSEGCHVMLYNGNQIKKLVVCDEDWENGKYFMIKASFGGPSTEPKNLILGDAHSYKMMMSGEVPKSGLWHDMQPATQ